MSGDSVQGRTALAALAQMRQGLDSHVNVNGSVASPAYRSFMLRGKPKLQLVAIMVEMGLGYSKSVRTTPRNMAITASLILLTVFVGLPLLAILYRITLITDPSRSKPIRHGRRNPNEPTHLLICLGSGGHTAEMLAMLTRAVETPLNRSNAKQNQKLEWRD
ncbi:hypothetical protein KC346_g17370, partial [Hortaea werneckii]